MKKTVLVFSIAGIIGATAALGFYFFGKSHTKNIDAHSSVQGSETEHNEKASLSASGKKINILFVGDMMFDRWIRQTAQNKGADFVFGGAAKLLQDHDLVVGNLEGPITDKPSVSVNSEFGSRENYIFTFPLETAKSMYGENIRLVNLGNNHILNFGEAGLAETKKQLAESKVHYFGNAGEDSNRFFIEDIKGIKIAFVNYNQFVRSAEEDALADLEAAKKMRPDFIIMYTHWGTEFVGAPGEHIMQLAHEFIDSGADLIIGSHPHVTQTKEQYNGKTIYYSLGNFIFDQYFDPNTRKGMAVQVEFDPNGSINFKEYNVEMKKNGQTNIN